MHVPHHTMSQITRGLMEAGQSNVMPADVQAWANLGGQFRDLVPDVVQPQCAGRYQGTAVLEHSLDLGHQRVVDLQRLGAPASARPATRGPKRPRRRRRSPPAATSDAGLSSARQAPRGRRTLPPRARSRHALPTSPVPPHRPGERPQRQAALSLRGSRLLCCGTSRGRSRCLDKGASDRPLTEGGIRLVGIGPGDPILLPELE